MFLRLLHKINRMRIETRTTISYVAVVLLVFFISILSILLIQYGKRLDTAIQEKYSPLITSLNAMQSWMEESGKLTTDLSIQADESKRIQLLHIQEKEYVGQKLKLIGICQEPGLEEMKSKILGIDKNFQSIMYDENELLKLPALNAPTIDAAGIREVKKRLGLIRNSLGQQKLRIQNLGIEAQELFKKEQSQKEAVYQNLCTLLLCMAFLVALLSGISIYLLRITLIKPLLELKHLLEETGNGKWNLPSAQEQRLDELGDLFHAVNKINSGLKAKEQVVQAIGKGDLDIRVPLLSKQDRLGKALAEMRDQLRSILASTKENTKLPERVEGKSETRQAETLTHAGEQEWEFLLHQLHHLTERIENRGERESVFPIQDFRNSLLEIEQQVQALIRFSRKGKTEEHQETISTRQLIFEVLENAGLPQNMTVLVDDQIPDIKGNKNDLTQVFQLYVLNATYRNKVSEPVINITFKRKDAYNEFCIADKGSEITADKQEIIFTRIASLVNPEDNKITGAGLALAKKIIEAYGGKVWLESVPGFGAKFFFSWPV